MCFILRMIKSETFLQGLNYRNVIAARHMLLHCSRRRTNCLRHRSLESDLNSGYVIKIGSGYQGDGMPG